MSVYKIFKDDLLYIGSTTDYKRRMRIHKYYCNNLNSKKSQYLVYKLIRENGGWDSFQKETLETNIQKDKLNEREEYYRKNLNANMNSQICYTGIKNKNEYIKEYRKKNKEKVKEYNKKQKEYQREYRKKRVICDCGIEISKGNKLRHNKRKPHLKRVIHGLKIVRFLKNYISSARR